MARGFFGALSIMFPAGERFFIASVAKFFDKAEPRLQREIALFLHQESSHSRVHDAFNSAIRLAGYDLREAEIYSKTRLLAGRFLPAADQIAITAAMEHFTAILSFEVLLRDRYFLTAGASVRNLWHWHALEELEHKAVAFDTFIMANSAVSAPSRWWRRVRAMRLATRLFCSSVWKGMTAILRQDGVHGTSAALRILWFFVGRPGLARRVLGAYLAFFIPGFRPLAGRRELALRRRHEAEVVRL